MMSASEVRAKIRELNEKKEAVVKKASAKRGRPKKNANIDPNEELKKIEKSAGKMADDAEKSLEKAGLDVDIEAAKPTIAYLMEQHQEHQQKENIEQYKALREEYDAVHADIQAISAETEAYNEPDTEECLQQAMEEPKEDAINPSHYKRGGLEAIDVLRAMLTPEEFRGYLKGTAFKYLWRAGYKLDAVEDLQKEQWFIAKLIEVLKGGM